MANVKNGNTLFVDATGSVTDRATIVYSIVVTTTGASAVLVLSDATSNEKKLELRVAATGTSQTFAFTDTPIRFPTGVEVTTITSAVATLVVSY